jgi:hypothetical protein
VNDREFLPAAPVSLAPGERYWFVLGSEAPGDGTFFWQYANSNFAAGTGVLGNYADTAESGANWIYRSTDFPYFMQVNVTGLAPPVADFDNDGVVDGEDLAAWQEGFGEFDGVGNPAAPADGDANGDFVVDGADFLAWQQQLGNVNMFAMNSASAAAVPEPLTLMLILQAVAFGSVLRRRVASV